MELEKTVWVFVMDGRQGRLLRCGLAPLERCHVEEHESIRNETPEHEHHRPSPLSGKGHSYAHPGHETEEQQQRFASAVVSWRRERTRRHEIDRLILFAPARFVGLLNRTLPPDLSSAVELQEGGLVSLSNAALARHPRIQALVHNGSHLARPA